MITTHQWGRTAGERKMLLFMPLFLFPFLSLLFWAAGGGKRSTSDAQINRDGGLNMQLPDAHLKSEGVTDKLSFYQQASKDSMKKAEQRRTDPFWNGVATGKKDSFLTPSYNDEEKTFSIDYNPLPSSGSNANSIDENEAKVYRKLQNLNRVLAQSKEPSTGTGQPTDHYNSGNNASDVDTRKLQAMMRGVNENNSKDPELDQLNTMLDKIAAIQHPGGDSHSASSGDSPMNKNTLTVRNQKKRSVVSLLTSGTGKEKQSSKPATKQNGFYSDEASSAFAIDTTKLNTFSAIVPQTEVTMSGSTVQLQLMQDIDVNGILIRKGTFLFGVASLNNERLQIKISSIQYGSNVYAISLEVYDMDGLTGIYVPGSMTRETAKASADQAINNIGIASLDPSLGGQAANAGIQTVKSLIGRKTKLVRVTLPAGYHVLLKDNHTN